MNITINLIIETTEYYLTSNYQGFLHFPNIYHLHIFTVVLKERKRIISRIHSSDNFDHPYLFIMFFQEKEKR